MMMNLFLFDAICKDPVIASLLQFRETEDESAYYTAARGLIAYAQHRRTDGNLIREYVLRTMLEQENLPDVVHLRDFLRQDVKAIYHSFWDTDWDSLFREKGLIPLSQISAAPLKDGLKSYSFSLQTMMECTSNEALGGALLAHVESFGTGIASAYPALRWDGTGLAGIANPDPISFADLTGLDRQKQVLIDNTERFLAGFPANDVLLTGGSGTGKSSCVKACLNHFRERGLRLVEFDKANLTELPRLLSALRNPILRYIVFIDDLSFEANDSSYKLLKSVLDGQAEARGSNVLIYATSNRRALIQETWSEREGYLQDEVHRNEGMSEKRSLAARFGINLSFPPPNQSEYLKIVENLLAAQGIAMTEEHRAEALRWELSYNGFSGRTAKQFVASMTGHESSYTIDNTTDFA